MRRNAAATAAERAWSVRVASLAGERVIAGNVHVSLPVRAVGRAGRCVCVTHCTSVRRVLLYDHQSLCDQRLMRTGSVSEHPSPSAYSTLAARLAISPLVQLSTALLYSPRVLSSRFPREY